ncbi:type III polyketide synthase [Gracilimonas sp. Q87]|uniref:type III polyketide synthase n=1 Tax=Gracilimonas sp. Q87 TaxID=3384766 RepID=UPI003983DCEB
MAIFVHDIATSVPSFSSDQQHIREVMKKHVGSNRKTQAIIHRVYSQSGIKKRHSVVKDFVPGDHGELFFNGSVKNEPGTAARNEVYARESKKLFVDVARKLLADNQHISSNDITHVITVSCTGFYAPGPDYEIVKMLKLKPSTQRFHVGFMGCFGAFPAMKMAKSFCESDPNANVLLVSAELCTLHFQMKNDTDSLISGSVFADGAAGMLISSTEPKKRAFEMQGFASALATEGEQDMAWTVGDTGFDMVLSKYVPEIIKSNLSAALSPIYKQYPVNKDEVDIWAIHPGGRSILDKIQENLQLSEKQIESSRKILADYGNMSSATVLFVLKDILDSELNNSNKIISMAFGPGLTIESGFFTVYHPDH